MQVGTTKTEKAILNFLPVAANDRTYELGCTGSFSLKLAGSVLLTLLQILCRFWIAAKNSFSTYVSTIAGAALFVGAEQTAGG